MSTDQQPQQQEKKEDSPQLKGLLEQLSTLEKTKGKKVQAIYQEATGLLNSSYHDPGIKKKADAKMQEFEKASAELGKEKEGIESQIFDITQGKDSQSAEERKKFLAARIERSNKAVQEPYKDLTRFSNPDLDKVRAQLQNNPLKGGDAAAIDDGTGGEGNKEENKGPAAQPTPTKK